MDFGMRLAKETQIGYFTFTKDMTVAWAAPRSQAGWTIAAPTADRRT